MKITDFEIVKIEASIIQFFEQYEAPLKLAPNLYWSNWSWQGGPHIMENGKQKYFAASDGYIVMSECKLHVSKHKTESERYQVHIFIPRIIHNKIGKHTILRNYLKSIAQDLSCRLDVNYSKSCGGFNKLVVTMRHHEN